jgi:hypothetical protein
MNATPTPDDVPARVVSEIKMLRVRVSRVSPYVAGRARGGYRGWSERERATHARFIERGYCFGISTRPVEG